MTIISRYIFKKLFLSFVFVTIILVMSIWLTQSLKLVDGFINKGIPLFICMKLVMLLLPDLISIVLPIGLLIAAIFTYNRLLNDSEIVIWRSVGASDWRLIRPALALTLMVCALLYALNLYFLPLAFQQSKDLEFQIKNTISINMIRSKEFTTIKDIMVYVDQRHRDGSLTGILINDARNPIKPCTITAEFGKMMDINGGTRLILLYGSRQEKDPATGAPSILSFDQYSVDLNTDDKKYAVRIRKPHERFISDLLNSSDTHVNPELRRKFIAEANQRLLMPLTGLIFVLIALSMMLKGDYNRRSRIKKIITIVCICVGFECLMLTLVNFGAQFNIALILGYLLNLVVIIVTLMYFFKQSQLRANT